MTRTPTDGHAHFHRSFSPSTFLKSAEHNLRLVNKRAQNTVGVLLLADPTDGYPLGRLEQAASALSGEWEYSKADSITSIFENSFTRLVLIAGRQIVTQENLELLSLCSDAVPAARLPMGEAIDWVLDNSGVPVIPWGFGKWLFSRGRVVRELIESKARPKFLLGDNGCRPRIIRSSILTQAENAGIAVLAGSDPLPLSSHQTRPATYGSLLPGEIDLHSPSAWVRDVLFGLDTSPSYGQPCGLAQFGLDQLRLRLARPQ